MSIADRYEEGRLSTMAAAMEVSPRLQQQRHYGRGACPVERGVSMGVECMAVSP